MSSPSKRRRTSPETYIAIHGQEQTATRATTTRRRSFQSPTKASLARSNPQVLRDLMQAKERRESEPARRNSLLAAVVANESTLPETAEQVITASDVEPAHDTENVLAQSKSDGPAGVMETEVALPDQIAQNEDPPSPPPFIPTPRHKRIAPFSSPSIVPRLVQSASKSMSRESRSPSTELPPTPVHLGMSNRSRGIVSSSPGGRARMRLRQRNEAITSSPLKPKAMGPIPIEADQSESDDHEVASGIGEDDVPDTGTELPFDAVDEGPRTNIEDPDIIEQKSQVLSLREELRILQEDCNNIASLSSMIIGNFPLPRFPEEEFESSAYMLADYHPGANKRMRPRPEDHELFKQNPSAYLELFVPSNLAISHSSLTQMIDERAKTVYQINIAASEPWPSNTFDMNLQLTTDLETGIAENIHIANTGNSDASLRKWLETLQQSFRSQPDMPMLLRGCSSFLRESTRRASVMYALDQDSKRETSETDVGHDGDETSVLKKARFLNRHQYVMVIQPSPAQDVHSPTRKIMLTYDLELDRLGHCTTQLDICATGVSNEVVRHSRKIFREVSLVDGPVKAMQTVRALLVGGTA